MNSRVQWLGFGAVFLAVLVLLPCVCRSAITWENRKIELTANPGEKEAVGVFHFKNSGNAPVAIISVKPSCNCVTTELAKMTYAPGETGVIKAVYTLGRQPGHQEKLIQVMTDNAPTHPTPLILRVNIPALFTCTPLILQWHLGEKPEEKSALIAPIDPQKLSGIEIKLITPAQASAKVEAFDQGAKYRLFVRPNSTAKYALVALFLTAKFSDGTTQPFIVHVLIR